MAAPPTDAFGQRRGIYSAFHAVLVELAKALIDEHGASVTSAGAAVERAAPLLLARIMH